MKYCEEYGPLLDAYVDGALSPADTLRTVEHLKTCEGCRAYVDAALSIRAAFPGEAEEAEVPAEFAAGVLSAIRAGAAPRPHTPPAQRRKFRWKKLALPLAACLALAVFAVQARWIDLRNNFQANAAVVRDSGAPEAAPEDGIALQEAPPETKARIAGTAGTVDNEAASEEAEAPAPDPGGTETSAAPDAGNSASCFDYTAGSAAPSPPMLPASTSARTEAQEDAAEAGAKKPAENAITVTLTPDQGGALADVLADCALERMDDDGGSAVYLLTADQFEAVLAELERLNIPASVTEADASAEHRLYVQYRTFS